MKLRDHERNLARKCLAVYLLLIALALMLLLSSLANAQWGQFSPQGSNDGQGILEDVLSRSANRQYWEKYGNDYATKCHEATHLLHNRIWNKAGAQAFYVGWGRYMLLPEPRVRYSAIKQFIAPQHKNNVYYDLYFVKQPASQPVFEQMPLYVLDEWSAEINGWQAAVEYGVQKPQDTWMTYHFTHYADALVKAVQQYDPQYSHMKELQEFVAYQKSRIASIQSQ
jgi:hypothetical protein